MSLILWGVGILAIIVLFGGAILGVYSWVQGNILMTGIIFGGIIYVYLNRKRLLQ